MRKLPVISGGRGPRFVRHTGLAEAAPRPVGGDGVVVPDALLEDRYIGASFLVAVADFDMGDALETAFARLSTCGIRGIIAPGFERSFYERCFVEGVLPVILDQAVIDELADRLASDPAREMTVDLERLTIEYPGAEPVAFDMNPRLRTKLLTGLTDLDEMIRHVGRAGALRRADRSRRPWLYEDP
ncbi:MAG TPA: hypothetical protein VLA09_14405 [Longimicrobiales bacterium]|nr:hypothetical protein [Longimicrobiales bacterium]